MQILESIKNNPLLTGAIFAPMDNNMLIIYLKENNNFILIEDLNFKFRIISNLSKVAFFCKFENIEEYLIKLLSYCNNDYEN